MHRNSARKNGVFVAMLGAFKKRGVIWDFVLQRSKMERIGLEIY